MKPTPPIALTLVGVLLSIAAPATPSPTTQPATQPSTRPTERRVHVIVTGRVQGVGFRAFTQAEARKLGLTGYVLNRADGTVEAVIEGPNDKVDALLERLKRGPDYARVDKLRVTEQQYKGEFKAFEIRYE